MYIGIFLFGVGTGLAAYRFVITIFMQNKPTTICHYCEWEKEKKELFK